MTDLKVLCMTKLSIFASGCTKVSSNNRIFIKSSRPAKIAELKPENCTNIPGNRKWKDNLLTLNKGGHNKR